MSSLAGQKIGKYEVLSLLGRGSMADVYRVHDPQLDRDAALKLIHPQFAAEEGFGERFSREARAAAHLRHPNIVQVFDFDAAGGRPYMVMELADGPTLKDRLNALREAGRLMPLPDVLRITQAVAAAIDYAHAQGVVHRDIKPSNILFMPGGEPLLADFGLAQISGQAMRTAAGPAGGTPAYVAPEQAQGNPQPASDRYSFAIVVYEMLAGRAPFAGSTATEVLLKQFQETPPNPLAWRPDLPPAIEPVFQKALAKNPAERYASAMEFASALQAALQSPVAAAVSQDAPSVHAGPVPVPAAPPVAVTPAQSPLAAAPAATEPPKTLEADKLPRVVEMLGAAALVVAPLIGREKVPVSARADDRRTALASLMAILGIFLAALQFIANALDLVTRAVAPLFQTLPVLIVVVLAVGALIAINLFRRSPSPQHRRYALLVLGVVVLGAAGWGGWQVYDRTRPPAGPIVLIADFQPCKSCKDYEYGRSVYERIKDQTQSLNLPNLEIRHVLETFPDSETARARGADYKATLVVWGWYDEQGVVPHFELLRLPEALPRNFIQPNTLGAPDYHIDSGAREITFVSLLALGLTRYAEGDYATALSLYDLSLQQVGSDPTQPAPNAEQAYYLKALTEYVSGESWSAIAADLKKALALKPDWPDVHYLLGLTYMSGCKPDGSMALDLALAESDAAVQLQATDRTYWLRGSVLGQMGHYADAAKSYEQSLKLKDDPGVRSALVDAYRQIGRSDLADAAQSTLAGTPAPAGSDLQSVRSRADVLYAQGRYADAAIAYQQAISSAVELKRPPITLAALYMSLADTQAAQKQYEAAVQSYLQVEALWGKNWIGYGSLALAYERLNRLDDALAAYQKVLDNVPCDESAHLGLAQIYEQQAKASNALDEYRKAAVANPANGVTLVSIALILSDQGKSDEANAELRTAVPLLEEQLRQEPVNADIAHVLGSANYLLNDYAAALAAFQKYIALAPDDPNGHYLVGAMLSALGRYAEAIPELEKANQGRPNSVITLLDLAEAYAKANRPADALAAYQNAVKADPKNTAAWGELAQFQAQQKNWAEAAKAYEVLAGLMPDDGPTHTSLAIAYLNLNRPADALKEFRAAANLQPTSALAQSNLAYALLNANLNDEAIAAAQRALQLDAQQVLPHYVLGMAYKVQGRKAQAIGELQLFVQNPAANPALRDAAVQALKELGG